MHAFLAVGIIGILGGSAVHQPDRRVQPDKVLELPARLAQVATRELANPFWQHYFGDTVANPCTHIISEHPDGDAVIGPCLHMKVQHPGGHDTGAVSPCLHFKQSGGVEHPGGHPIIAACTHFVMEHPEGHDTGVRTPCIHIRAEHPEGHGAATVPCVHPMPLVSVDVSRAINFYTDNAIVQGAMRRAADQFMEWGFNAGGAPFAIHTDATGSEIVTGSPRPLCVFNHGPVNGNPWDNKDPMWSHYRRDLHSIQITEGGPDDAETVFHEMGHAACGNACSAVMTPGGPHTLDTATDGGLAVSEGWASFIAVAMEHERSDSAPMYRDNNIEAADRASAPFSAMNEYRVMCILWDLYDTTNEAGDSVSLEMSELFKVFNPTLATFSQGFEIRDLDDYITRLKANNPKFSRQIDALVTMNLTPPSKDSLRPGRLDRGR